MKPARPQTSLQQLGNALRTQVEDTLTCEQCQLLLPEMIQGEQSQDNGAGQHTVAVHNHLALCPYCTAAYEQVREWITASLQDTPRAVVYPTFDLSFLQPPPPVTPARAWPLALLQERRRQGEQWLHDLTSGLYLFFAPTPGLAEVGWAVKADAAELPLARTSFVEETLPGWEIEATIFATTADQCRVEIAVYAATPLTDDLAGIDISLYDGVNERVACTDANGLVEFDAIPRTRIGELILRIELPDAG